MAIILASVLFIALFALAFTSTYNTYLSTIVSERQQLLLTLSRSVSSNLELYLSEQIFDMDVLSGSPGFSEAMDAYYQHEGSEALKQYLLTYLLSQSQELSRMYLVDRDGNIVLRYSHYPAIEGFDEQALDAQALVRRGMSGIDRVIEVGPHHYAVSLVNCFYSGEKLLGALIGVIDLQYLYDLMLAPVKVGEHGYLEVKDREGRVIMHPSAQTIGENFLEAVEREPENYPADYFALLEEQYRDESGTAIYHHDGVPGDPLIGQQMLQAYSRVNIAGNYWIVSAIVTFDEATTTGSEGIWQISIIYGALLLLLLASLGVIIYLQNYRQRLEAQTAYLRGVNSSLEELNRSQEQLLHYQKLQTIGTFSSGITHEFNNLLTPILGYTEMLHDHMADDPEGREYVEEVFKAGTRAKEIVQQILLFSRKGSDMARYALVDIDALLRDAVKLAKMVLPASVTLRTDFAETCVSVYGYNTQLHQVLLNLCSNAYQAMEKSGGIITISSRLIPMAQHVPPGNITPTEDDYICISVTDTGCGMPADVLARIFDPFYTTKAAGSGTGLGLAVAQSIVENHGGYITATSEIDKGSTFAVYLPVCRAIPSPEPELAELGDTVQSARLLLVDDQQHALKLVKEWLTKRGYQVVATNDPRRALQFVMEAPQRYDAVITDYIMPELKGTELAARIKKIREDLPVLLITGLAQDATENPQSAQYVDVILAKPINFRELTHYLREVLTHRA